MVDRPGRVCVPIEVEMLPLYREPRGAARAVRAKRRQRSSLRSRLWRRLVTVARAVTRRSRA